ncbi:DUF4340 domain-containing protein [bacterium]|nr:DUF4340 domain-containing protein [bacterium]
MSERNLKIFGIVFLSLLLIYIITKPRNHSIDIDKLVQSVVIGVEPEDVGSIEVYRELGENKSAKILFLKKDNQWRIESHFNCKAESSRISSLINDVLEMTGKVRSSDPARFDLYKIGDSEGIHLLLKDNGGNPLANLIIGKKPEDPSSGFVRIAGRNKVYFTDKSLLASLGIYGDIDTLTTFSVDRFVDLDAVTQDRSKLDMVGVVKNSKKVVVRQKEKEQPKAKSDTTKAPVKKKVWVLVRGKKEVSIDQNEAKKFLDNVTKISAQEVVDRLGGTFSDYNKSVKYGFQNSAKYIVFRKSDGTQQVVVFGKPYDKDKGFYMLVKYDDGLVYKVLKSKCDDIFKWIKELPEKAVKK